MLSGVMDNSAFYENIIIFPSPHGKLANLSSLVMNTMENVGSVGQGPSLDKTERFKNFREYKLSRS